MDDLSAKIERCWKGYEPVPGKEPYSKGSCRKEDDAYEKAKEALQLPSDPDRNIPDPATVAFLKGQLEQLVESSTAMPDLWNRPRDWK